MSADLVPHPYGSEESPLALSAEEREALAINRDRSKPVELRNTTAKACRQLLKRHTREIAAVLADARGEPLDDDEKRVLTTQIFLMHTRYNATGGVDTLVEVLSRGPSETCQRLAHELATAFGHGLDNHDKEL